MSVYVVTGVSRGIGFEFLKQLSDDANGLVIGLVRDKAATEKKVAAELGRRSNVHILEADLTKYASLKNAAGEAARIVGDRGIDYLVANGAYVPSFDAFDAIGTLCRHHAADADQRHWQYPPIPPFPPLILKGQTKKVIAITTGLADVDSTNLMEVETSSLYAASKAALNMVVAKFNAQYKDGVLFLSISPGVVEVGQYANITPEQGQSLMKFMGTVATYAPDFKGPSSPEDAVRQVKATWEKATIGSGFGGAFVSHHGDKNWI
ncbi:short chain dehydrogenase [Apiospora marii]|uniref:Short chain dehydrogenase n=1 Tax=Apiospora marii TaxID=335849 RepID=A0ABR1R824_9PEZI